MRSILNEIQKLRDGCPLNLDRSNRNRYRVVTFEDDGSKTAYCFSAPLYNTKTKALVDLRWQQKGAENTFEGTKASVCVTTNMISLHDEDGDCHFSLQDPINIRNSDYLGGIGIKLRPTLNGVLCETTCTEKTPYKHILKTNAGDLQIRTNNKYFALMRSKFTPFVVISCIGTIDAVGNIIAPAEIHGRQLSNDMYEVCLHTKSPFGMGILYEINLYENKLLQDTTVESKTPDTNNAFGGIAFIGKTAAYGEQWLYSRPDLTMLPEMMGTQINHAFLHSKVWNQNPVPLTGFFVTARFCSFGSNWNNKIRSGDMVAHSEANANYLSLNITSMIAEHRTRFIKPSEGMIFKTKMKDTGFAVLSTGDSCTAPQVLEINFR